jgi:TP901 family phage tail tape measure protein
MAKTYTVGFTIGAALGSSFGKTCATATQKMKGIGKALDEMRIQKGAAKDLVKYQAELEELSARQKAAGFSSSTLNQQVSEAQARYYRAAQAARKYGVSISDAAAENKKLGAAITATERKMARMRKAQQNKQVRSEMGGQMIGAVGAVMTLAAPIREAIQYESVMADVAKVVDFPTPVAFKAMSNDILNMSTTIPMAASGIGAIVAAAGQAGIAKDELKAFATNAARMGIAFDLSGDEAGSTMAAWRAAMDLTQGQTVNLGDAVNYLSNNMNAQAGALAEVLKRQGAVAKSAGLTTVQTASLGAALLSSGTGPEIAATAMKNLTGALTKGQAATKAQSDAFESLGFDSVSLAERMQTDAKGAIMDVFAALKDAPKAEQSSLVSQLFGEESKGAIMPLLQNIGNLKQAFELTGDATQYAGSMQAEYEQRSKTTANNVQLMRNQIARAGVKLGTVLLPPLNMVMGVLGSAIGVVADFSDKFPMLTTVVIGAAAGLITIKVAAIAAKYAGTLLSDGWLIAKAAFDFFRPSVLATNIALLKQKAVAIGTAVVTKSVAIGTKAWTAAQWLLNAAMTANPIGLVIAGVAALAAGAYFLVTKWDSVKAFFSGLWDWFGNIDLAESGKKLVLTFVNGIKAVATAPFKAVKWVLGKVRKLLPFSDAKEGPLSRLTESGRKVLSTMGNGMKQAAPGMKQTASAALEGAAGALTVQPPLLGEAVGTARYETEIPTTPDLPDARALLLRNLQPVQYAASANTPKAGGISISFSPTINLPAGSTDKPSALESGLLASEARLREMLSRILADDRRLSYA